MKENRLTFQSQNLIVDYLEFKFNVLPEFIKQKIVQSFFKLGFNSFDVDKKYRDPVQDSIQTNSKNQYQIQFVVNISSYWNGVCVAFPGLIKHKTLALNYLPRRSPSKYCRRFITFHN